MRTSRRLPSKIILTSFDYDYPFITPPPQSWKGAVVSGAGGDSPPVGRRLAPWSACQHSRGDQCRAGQSEDLRQQRRRALRTRTLLLENNLIGTTVLWTTALI